jgi:cytidyltransferase-like protein
MLKTHKNTVLLFGSFDGLHPGHEYLINQAQQHSNDIVIVVAQDMVIKRVKGRLPFYDLNTRIQNLKAKFPTVTAIAGDPERGTWSAIKEYKPQTILVGYDQEALYNVLGEIKDTYGFTIVQCKPFHPDQYKSSILRKRKDTL